MSESSNQTTLTTSEIAYRNFIETCRSPATRYMYDRALHYYMSYLRLLPEAYDKLLEMDSKIAQMNVCDYILFLRKSKQGKLAPRSISVYLSAIRKFYSMNDIQLNWEKIHSFEGEDEKLAEDRPYTHSEIQTLLQKASPRNRAIILLMASGGLRVGAISSLRLMDLEPIDRYQIYKVNVYAQSKKSHYFTFCTTETRKEIDSYLEWRRRWGEKLGNNSPLFRRDFNAKIELGRLQVRPLQTTAVRCAMYMLLKDTGIKPIIPNTEFSNPTRGHIMECHGLRKFFETNAFKAGMNNIYIRRLMGQKSQLEDSYLKTSEEELLESDSRHIGYIGVIDQLTINEEYKLRREVEHYKVKASQFDSLRAEIDTIKALMKK